MKAEVSTADQVRNRIKELAQKAKAPKVEYGNTIFSAWERDHG